MRIWFEQRPVAELEAGEHGPSLRYLPEWQGLRGAFPVSTRMPLSEPSYGPETVVPWIVNLLPESQNLETISRLTGVSQQDVLGLLDRIGRDTSGALSFAERGSTDMTYRPVPQEEDLERVLDELPAKPFLVGEEGVSMSLAGVQTKLGVHLDEDGRVCIPVDGAPSTWILKPDAKSLWGGVYNEAFCLLLARAIGLDAPEVRIGTAGERKFLLVRRYDRRQDGTHWRRLHQEDYCQALGLFPASKYERNSTGTPGPKVRDLVAVTRSVADLASVTRLLQVVVFNIIACNTDAHGKNYSLMISGRGARLAPTYDIMCGAVWPKVTKNLSNTIAGKNRGDYIKGRHWQREALLCGLNPQAVLRQVKTLCDRVQPALDDTIEAVADLDPKGRGMAELCAAEIRQRAIFLANGLEETEPDLAGWAARNVGTVQEENHGPERS